MLSIKLLLRSQQGTEVFTHRRQWRSGRVVRHALDLQYPEQLTLDAATGVKLFTFTQNDPT
jgi:hypothetical protein